MAEITPEGLIDDTAGISDGAILLRRIPPREIDWGRLNADGSPHIRSGAFQDLGMDRARELGYPRRCMSVGLKQVLDQLGEAPSVLLKVLTGPVEGWGVAALTVRAVRYLKAANGADIPQGVAAMPTTAEPWHAVVFSTTTPDKTPAMKKALAREARWIVLPQ